MLGSAVLGPEGTYLLQENTVKCQNTVFQVLANEVLTATQPAAIQPGVVLVKWQAGPHRHQTTATTLVRGMLEAYTKPVN